MESRAATNRDEYVIGLERRVEALERAFERLQWEAEGSLTRPSRRLKEMKRTFDERRRRLHVMIAKAKNASDAAWEEVRSGIESARSELEGAFDRAWKELTSHPSPGGGASWERPSSRN